jgi:hypothetical protein
LHGVACELRVSKDQPSGRVQPRNGQVDEAREGVMIALPGSFHETLLIQNRLDLWHDRVVVLKRVWRRYRQKRSVKLGRPRGFSDEPVLRP